MSETINGRYRLHYKLGQGGMGTVHLATDRLTQTQVAFKQVHLKPLFVAGGSETQTSRDLLLALAQEFQIL
ncbi:MAG: hypothetical protein GY805_31740, partial [Chloroflexi bacterium]|nr:hypothetical protein [Chloroflexota bacterium]